MRRRCRATACSTSSSVEVSDEADGHTRHLLVGVYGGGERGLGLLLGSWLWVSRGCWTR